MSIPKDQSLALTIFLSVSLFVVLLFWISLPVHYSIHNEDEEEEGIQILEPSKAIPTAKGLIFEVEKAIAQLEEDEKKDKGDQEKQPKGTGEK